MLEPITVVEMGLGPNDHEGVAVLKVVYDRPDFDKRLGFRRRLDRPPTAGNPSWPLADWLAEWIAWMELSEPLERRADLLVEGEQDIWWWGDGFPDLHPDHLMVQQLLDQVLRRSKSSEPQTGGGELGEHDA